MDGSALDNNLSTHHKNLKPVIIHKQMRQRIMSHIVVPPTLPKLEPKYIQNGRPQNPSNKQPARSCELTKLMANDNIENFTSQIINYIPGTYGTVVYQLLYLSSLIS